MARSKDITIRTNRASRKGKALGQKASGLSEDDKKQMRRWNPYTTAETQSAWESAFVSASGI